MNLFRKIPRKGFLFLFLFFIGANMMAQSDKRITIKRSNITLQTALAEVQKQSDMSIAYNDSKLPQKSISIDIKNQSLEQALSEILKGTQHTYLIKDNYIMIIPENKKQGVEQVVKKISGQIVDDQNMPLIGVNVLVKGKAGVGSITDIDGNYTLEVNIGDILEISYVGYASQSVTVTDQDVYNVKMSSDTELLDEVVVTALGIKRKAKVLGYNLKEVKSEELTAAKDANFVNSLTGKVAGLQINASSGGVGGATKVVMRGAKSITKDNNVLYVIDGVPLYR